MKALLHLVIELGLLAVLVCIVWRATTEVQRRMLITPTANEQLLAASWDADGDLFERSLSAGASVHGRDASGTTALHYAALSRDVRLVTRLIDLGADPNAQKLNGTTPLAEAVLTDDAAVSEVLFRSAAADGEVLTVAELTEADHLLALLRGVAAISPA